MAPPLLLDTNVYTFVTDTRNPKPEWDALVRGRILVLSFVTVGEVGYAWIPDSLYAPGSYTVFLTPHPIWTACATYNDGDSVTKASGKNVTYGAGVGFKQITLSAQAGWSYDTSEKWSFERSSYWCGSTAKGPASSPEAEAHSKY